MERLVNFAFRQQNSEKERNYVGHAERSGDASAKIVFSGFGKTFGER
jgi:hypothetical protein